MPRARSGKAGASNGSHGAAVTRRAKAQKKATKATTSRTARGRQRAPVEEAPPEGNEAENEDYYNDPGGSEEAGHGNDSGQDNGAVDGPLGDEAAFAADPEDYEPPTKEAVVEHDFGPPPESLNWSLSFQIVTRTEGDERVKIPAVQAITERRKWPCNVAAQEVCFWLKVKEMDIGTFLTPRLDELRRPGAGYRPTRLTVEIKRIRTVLYSVEFNATARRLSTLASNLSTSLLEESIFGIASPLECKAVLSVVVNVPPAAGPGPVTPSSTFGLPERRVSTTPGTFRQPYPAPAASVPAIGIALPTPGTGKTPISARTQTSAIHDTVMWKRQTYANLCDKWACKLGSRCKARKEADDGSGRVQFCYPLAPERTCWPVTTTELALWADLIVRGKCTEETAPEDLLLGWYQKKLAANVRPAVDEPPRGRGRTRGESNEAAVAGALKDALTGFSINTAPVYHNYDRSRRRRRRRSSSESSSSVSRSRSRNRRRRRHRKRRQRSSSSSFRSSSSSRSHSKRRRRRARRSRSKGKKREESLPRMAPASFAEGVKAASRTYSLAIRSSSPAASIAPKHQRFVSVANSHNRPESPLDHLANAALASGKQLPSTDLRQASVERQRNAAENWLSEAPTEGEEEEEEETENRRNDGQSDGNPFAISSDPADSDLNACS